MGWEGYKQINGADDLEGFPITLGDPDANDLSEAEKSQVTAATKAAKKLITELGDAETYNVWLSGNVNPHGVERHGVDNHTISVTVGIAAYTGHSERHPAGSTESVEA